MSNADDNLNGDVLSQADALELHELCTRLVDEVITDSEMVRLDQMLNSSSAARDIYLRYVDLQHALTISTGKQLRTAAESLRCHVAAIVQEQETGLDEPVAEMVEPGTKPGRTRPGYRALFSWTIAATLLVAATLSAILSLPDSDSQVAKNNDGTRSEPISETLQGKKPIHFAKISYVSSAVRWDKSKGPIQPQTDIQEGKLLSLIDGEVELTYDTGTRILLVGPAEFVVENAGGKLRRGGLIASVTEAGHGFTIETPNGKIVDLGTEFGVAVDDIGISEVGVFRGEVEAFPQGNEKFKLTKGRGIQWHENDFTPLDADLRRFVTSVLDLSADGGAAEGRASVVDRFREESLDEQKWTTLGDARLTGAGLELLGNGDSNNRPCLISAEQFDPAQGPITITCDFRFTDTESGYSPSLSVLTRSAKTRGVALPPWSGALASCVRCSFGSEKDSDEGVILTGVKMESDRELASLSGSRFWPPTVGTPYRVVMHDDGVNVSYTVSLLDDPSTSKTVTCRSLFRGRFNYVALEGSVDGGVVVDRVEISQDSTARPLSSYAEASALTIEGERQRELQQRSLEKLVPDAANLVLQDSFDGEQLNEEKWAIRGDVQLRHGAVQLGIPNAEGHIHTHNQRQYLLSRQRFDVEAGALTILGKVSFSENFLSGYGASFAVITRSDHRWGHDQSYGWASSLLQRGVRANFWPAAWDTQRNLEIHELAGPNAIQLLATEGVKVDPRARTYLFQAIDDGNSVKLTLIDPRRAERRLTITSPTSLARDDGCVGFECTWGSPVSLDDLQVFQADNPEDSQTASTHEVRQQEQTKILRLSGATADLAGPPIRQSRGCLTYWHDVNSTATWKLFAHRPCRVEVEVLAAVQQPHVGSTFDLHVGGQRLSGTLKNTGSWESYQTVSLGTTQVEAGELAVSLNPTSLTNGVFGNVKAVILKGEHLAYNSPHRKPDFSGPVKVFTTAQYHDSRLEEQDSLKAVDQISADAVTLVVDPEKRFQTIEGFGGAFTEAAGIVFAKLSPARQQEVLQAYFDAENGHGYRLCRTHINSCDFSAGNYAYTEVKGDVELKHFSIDHDREYLIPLIHAANEVAGEEEIKILASPWSPPAWMKTNGQMTEGGKLKPEYRDAWARYYCRYIAEYSKEGIDIWGLTVQNEPDAVQRWESCIYSAEEERDFVRDHLGPTLHRNGLEHVKLLVWDHNRDQLFDRARTVFEDPEAAKYVWGAGFHWYVSDDYHHAQMVHDFYPDKKLLFTEGCLESGPQIGDWSGGEHYARSVINDLNHGTVGWIDWNLLLNTEGGPNHVGNFCSAPIIADVEQDRLIYNNSYYYLGHFSRFVLPGAQRLLCGNTGKDILSTAFVNPDGSIAIVILNEQDYPIRYALTVGDLQTETISPENSITTLVIDAVVRTANSAVRVSP